MTCRIRAILDGLWNGDREQVDLIVADRTRNVELIARSLHSLDGELTGSDVRRHQLATCDCNGWID